MRTAYLFEVPQIKQHKKSRLKAFKEKHGIETWFSKGFEQDGVPWMACLMPRARQFGYGVTPTSSLCDCVSKVGRLLEEAGVLVEGKTEWLTIKKLCEANNIIFDP